MTIDFEDLELPLARLAAAGVDAPSPVVRDRIMARVRNDEPALPPGFVFSLAASDQWPVGEPDQWLCHAAARRAARHPFPAPSPFGR